MHRKRYPNSEHRNQLIRTCNVFCGLARFAFKIFAKRKERGLDRIKEIENAD
jgi:hypothetical protein